MVFAAAVVSGIYLFYFYFFLYCLRQLYLRYALEGRLYTFRTTVSLPPFLVTKRQNDLTVSQPCEKKSSNMLSLTFTSYNFELTFKMSSNKVSITNPISRDQEAFSVL